MSFEDVSIAHGSSTGGATSGTPASTGVVPARDDATRDDRVWIAWERQRRSLSLAKRVRARLFLCIDENKGWRRYPLSIAKTVRELRRRRGQIVFVQNPSMVLATLACLLKGLFGYLLVVDRHSNFGFLSDRNSGIKARISELLSQFTLRNADVTIVTNAELAEVVRQAGGHPFVLPDPFPELVNVERNVRQPDAPREILFAASWANDEPIAAAIEACRNLRGEAVVRITGRMKAKYADVVAAAPDNFVLTGFVSDGEYFELMAMCDAVMAVSTRPATLVCAGYEGATFGKPLILGNSAALREYFNAGAVYTDGTARDLEMQIRTVLASLPAYQRDIRAFYTQRSSEWETLIADLEGELLARSPRPSRP